jgi:hypothetical protein
MQSEMAALSVSAVIYMENNELIHIKQYEEIN